MEEKNRKKSLTGRNACNIISYATHTKENQEKLHLFSIRFFCLKQKYFHYGMYIPELNIRQQLNLLNTCVKRSM